MDAPKSADELAQLYGSDEMRAALSPILGLQNLLTECVIRKDYQVHREMYEAMVLSPSGLDFTEQLSKKGRYHEARFICFLEIGHTDLFFDPLTSILTGSQE